MDKSIPLISLDVIDLPPKILVNTPLPVFKSLCIVWNDLLNKPILLVALSILLLNVLNIVLFIFANCGSLALLPCGEVDLSAMWSSSKPLCGVTVFVIDFKQVY